MILCLCVISFSLPGLKYSGDRVFYCDARSLALGGASVVNVGGSNPALFPQKQFQIDFNYNPVFVNEKRGLRVYDNYGNNMGISTIAENAALINKYGASFAIKPFDFLYLGCRFTPAWDFSYEYEHESRDDFYQLISIEEINNHGSINDLEPAIGLMIGKVSMGASYIKRFGSIHYRYSLIENDVDSIIESSLSYQGSTGRIGLCCRTSLGVDIGYSYTHRSYLSADSNGLDIEYPASHIFGFAYQPSSRIPTRLNAELMYEKWTVPLFVYKLGVEHYIAGDHSLRYGLCFFPDYIEGSLWTTAFAVGYGIKKDPLALDIAYCYAKRDYPSDRLGLDLSENLHISESINNILFSINYSF